MLEPVSFCLFYKAKRSRIASVRVRLGVGRRRVVFGRLPSRLAKQGTTENKSDNEK
jgi:hypothetical protein